jgi:hypothetical protein
MAGKSNAIIFPPNQQHGKMMALLMEEKCSALTVEILSRQ